VPVWAGGIHPSLLGTALVAVMFTYEGWADLTRVSGEMREPARNLPRALLWGTTLVAALYLVANIAYIYLIPIERMGDIKLIASAAAERIPMLGKAASGLTAVLVLVSCFGNLCEGTLVMPRTQFAMADRGLFFQPWARISPRFKTPSIAIWALVGSAVVYALASEFQRLADSFILGLWPFYTLGVAAVFVLRRARPLLPRPYRVWGYPFIPAIFLIASVGMILNALWTDPKNTGITFAVIIAGVPLYYVWKRISRDS
jgi:APA family basic amino acid/polyamine antiporter